MILICHVCKEKAQSTSEMWVFTNNEYHQGCAILENEQYRLEVQSWIDEENANNPPDSSVGQSECTYEDFLSEIQWSDNPEIGEISETSEEYQAYIKEQQTEQLLHIHTDNMERYYSTFC